MKKDINKSCGNNNMKNGSLAAAAPPSRSSRRGEAARALGVASAGGYMYSGCM